MAQKKIKKPARKAPKKSNPRKSPRKSNPRKGKGRRPRRRRRNPGVGAAFVTVAKAIGGVLAGSVVGGGLFYLTKDVDLNRAVFGAVDLVGGGLVAAYQPIDPVFSVCAGGMLGALGIGEMATGLIGARSEKVTPVVDTATMLPESPMVEPAMAPPVKGAIGEGGFNGDYGGVEAPIPSYAGVEVPAELV